MTPTRIAFIFGLSSALLTAGVTTAQADDDSGRRGRGRPASAPNPRIDSDYQRLVRAHARLKQRLETTLERENRLRVQLSQVNKHDDHHRRRIAELKRRLDRAESRAQTAESRLGRAHARADKAERERRQIQKRAERDRQQMQKDAERMTRRMDRMKRKLRRCRSVRGVAHSQDHKNSPWTQRDEWEGFDDRRR